MGKEGEAARLRSTDLRRVRLGRYPFTAGIKYYLAKQEAFLAPSTLLEDEKKLRQFSKLFDHTEHILKRDPRHIRSEEVEEFILWMRRRDLAVSTIEKNLDVLNRYLLTWSNRIIKDMRERHDIRMPKMARKSPIQAMTTNDVQAVFDTADEMEGWRGMIARGVLALAYGTAVRPKEIRLAHTADLQLQNGQYYVRHPKGEGSWASPQWVGILRGDMIRRLERYIQERDEALKRLDLETKYLFPKKDGTPYSSNALREIMRAISEKSGVDFSLKVMRSSFASNMIAGDLSRMKAISLQLRHSSVKTTEDYYLRINASKEIRTVLGDLWKTDEIQ